MQERLLLATNLAMKEAQSEVHDIVALYFFKVIRILVYLFQCPAYATADAGYIFQQSFPQQLHAKLQYLMANPSAAAQQQHQPKTV